MRFLATLLILAAHALAQVPQKSVIGNTTIWVSDVPVSLPYSADVTMTSVSACSTDSVTGFSFLVFYEAIYADGTSVIANLQQQPLSIAKTEIGYCGSIIVPIGRAKITKVFADQTQTFNIAPPDAPPPTSGSTASKRRS